jgi:hypothetical protein
MILKIWEIRYFFWFWANYILGHFSGYFEGASTFLTPLEISLEMAHYVVCPQKKIISRIFKISGALIVIRYQVPLFKKLRDTIFFWGTITL